MYYVIELTCIGPTIKEVFKSKELAVQYTTALHGNYPDKHYQITKVEPRYGQHRVDLTGVRLFNAHIY